MKPAISGRGITTSGNWLTGAALVGLVIDLRDDRGDRYALRFAAAGASAYWAGSSGTVPTYTLTYTTATQQMPQPLCTAGINEAILFEGDRFDAARRKPSTSWADPLG